jgi:hypothetical protein
MRKFILLAAIVAASATSALAGDSRSLSLAGVDEKIPAALGKAAETPKVVEAPKPPDPPKPPEPPKAAETAKPAEEPAPQFVTRPALGKKAEPSRANSNRDGQVTFEDKKPAAKEPVAVKEPVAAKDSAAVETQDRPAVENKPEQKTAKADKPRRKRSQHWNEARIMRELYRYGVMAGGWGGW